MTSQDQAISPQSPVDFAPEGQQSQEQRRSTPADDQRTPDIPAECPRCGNVSRKKRRIECSLCNREWQLTCVRLKRSQADVLRCWWCPDCANRTKASPNTRSQAELGHRSCLKMTDRNLAETLSKLKQSRKVVPRIPKGARIPAADALTKLLESGFERANSCILGKAS